MKKTISIYSFLLFIIPVITLSICHQMHASYTGIHTIPFIDGKVSVSLIGRQDYTIGIFKPGFFLYIFISILFYFKISNFFELNHIKNNFKILGIFVNIALSIYILALGKEDSFYAISRRLGIILYITGIIILQI